MEVSYINPNKATVRKGGDQFTLIQARDGYVHDYMVEDTKYLVSLCDSLEHKYHLAIKLRLVYCDNSNGNIHAVIHVLSKIAVDKAASIPFEFHTSTPNSQGLSVTFKFLLCNTTSDHFEANAEDFYSPTLIKHDLAESPIVS